MLGFLRPPDDRRHVGVTYVVCDKTQKRFVSVPKDALDANGVIKYLGFFSPAFFFFFCEIFLFILLILAGQANDLPPPLCRGPHPPPRALQLHVLWAHEQRRPPGPHPPQIKAHEREQGARHPRLLPPQGGVREVCSKHITEQEAAESLQSDDPDLVARTRAAIEKLMQEVELQGNWEGEREKRTEMTFIHS